MIADLWEFLGRIGGSIIIWKSLSSNSYVEGCRCFEEVYYHVFGTASSRRYVHSCLEVSGGPSKSVKFGKWKMDLLILWKVILCHVTLTVTLTINLAFASSLTTCFKSPRCSEAGTSICGVPPVVWKQSTYSVLPAPSPHSAETPINR